jgi:transposase
MKELIKILDKKLEYREHEIKGKNMQIFVKSAERSARCPHCGNESKKVHLIYERKIQDLPIQGMKVLIFLERMNYFCYNTDCSHKTFAERFDFFEPKARKTKRLQSEILRVSLNQSSVSAAKYLCESVADVGKSTICNLLKKGPS